MLRTIKLAGHLGRKFGKEYKFDVNSPAEAIRALCSQVKGFKHYISEGKGKDKKFKVVVNDKPLENYDKEMHSLQEGEIAIVPYVRGSGQKILGAVMFVVGAYLYWTGSGYAMMAAGMAMMAGGMMMMMTKPPNQMNAAEKDSSENRSYLFNGSVNTVQQGQPIPIGYGRLRIGSQVVSAEVSSTQVPV